MAGFIRSLKAAIAAGAAACLAAACGVEPEGRALIEDAGLERAEPDCARIVGAGEIAKLSGLNRTGGRLHEAAEAAACPTAVRAEPYSGALLVGGLMTVQDALVRIESLWDERLRLFVRQRDALPDGCTASPVTLDWAAEPLIETYLADPQRRILVAKRAAADAEEICTEARLAARASSLAAEDPELARYWAFAASSGRDAAASRFAIDQAESLCLDTAPEAASQPALQAQSQEGPEAAGEAGGDECAFAVGIALRTVLERADLFDFATIERALQAESLVGSGDGPAPSILEDYFAEQGLETLALWAIMAPQLGLSVSDAHARHAEAMRQADPYFYVTARFDLLDAIAEAVFAPDTTPQAPALLIAASQACAGFDDLEVWLSVWRIDTLSQRELRCLRTLGRVVEPMDWLSADRGLELAAALRLEPVDAWDAPGMIELAARLDQDTLAAIAPDTAAAGDRDEHYCFRPAPAYEPLWTAAAPTLFSADCERLAAAGIDPLDRRAIADLLPFETCPEAIIGGDEGLRRRLRLAMRLGEERAFSCAVQIVRGSPDRRDAAALRAVYAGVRTGRLPDDTFETLRRDGVSIDVDEIANDPLLGFEFPQVDALVESEGPAKPERDGPATPKPAPDPAPAEPKPGPQ